MTDIPASAAKLLRPESPQLIQRIIGEIQHEIKVYAGPPDAPRGRDIAEAVDAAVTYFLDVLENKPTSEDRVRELFRRIGYGEALAQNDLDAMRAAYSIAIRRGWERMHELIEANGLPGNSVASFGDALFAYMEQLMSQVAIGHAAAEETLRESGHEQRGQLFAALLARAPLEELQELARLASWEMPDEAVVILTENNRPIAAHRLPQTSSVLLGHIGKQQVAIVTAADNTEAINQMLAVLPHQRRAISWTVKIDEVADACRWTNRALMLAAKGVIKQSYSIDCSDYRLLLWFHADPALDRQMTADILAPLDAEGNHHREMLIITMREWLRSRESAPALAAKLGVHEQTVRNRIKRIRKLFGTQVENPQGVVTLLMALEVAAADLDDESAKSPAG